MSNRILITGGAGFIGLHLARHLVSYGYQVKVYTYLKKNRYAGDTYKALKEYKGTLQKINSLNKNGIKVKKRTSTYTTINKFNSNYLHSKNKRKYQFRIK